MILEYLNFVDSCFLPLALLAEPIWELSFYLHTAVVEVAVTLDTVNHFTIVWLFTLYADFRCFQVRIVVSCQ